MFWDFLPGSVERYCRRWREELFSDDEWETDPRDAEQPTSGEAGGFRVVDGAPYGAYLKPVGKTDRNPPRAAYEKLSADLGQDLSVPVPPAILFRRDDAPNGQADCTVLSLFLADDVQRLKDIKALPDPPWDLVEEAYEEGSGGIVLDTWLQNQDRNNNRNILFLGWEDRPGLTVAFIDFAFAMNKNRNWEDGGWQNVSLPDLPDRLQDAADPDRIEEALDALEGMETEEIRELAERIPDDYMSDDHRGVILEGLIGRQNQIRPALENHFNL